MEKKVPGRFTIGFNLADPAHQRVAEMLNQQGRRKAQFLVNAVLHYVSCAETPEVSSTMLPGGTKAMEKLVLRVLAERGYEDKREAMEVQTMPEPREQVDAVPSSSVDPIDGVEFAAIADTLAAFRQ